MKNFIMLVMLAVIAQTASAQDLKKSVELKAGDGFQWGAELKMDGHPDAHSRYSIRVWHHLSAAEKHRATKVTLNSRMLESDAEPVTCENAQKQDRVFVLSGEAPSMDGSLMNWDGGKRSFALCVLNSDDQIIAELKDVIETTPN